MKPLHLLLGILLVAGAQSHAELQFEATTLERTVSVAEGKVPVTFRFTNRSSRKVKVERINTTCGCLRADANKKFYDPGEVGIIEAEFSTTGHPGIHQKSIEVQTNLRSQKEVKLTVKINATPILTVEPQMTLWKVGSPATPKRVRIEVVDSSYGPVGIKTISASRKSVAAQLHTIEAGKVYEVELTPETTATKVLGALKIETDSKIDSQKKLMAFFRVGD